MLIDPDSLTTNLSCLESIEKGSIRLVTQALYDFREVAAEIFRRESDLAQDIAEDITREALDRIGVSKIDTRLFGKMDYKRARYVFNRDYAIRQALFVDSKAEKVEGQDTATLQTAQTSMRIRHIRAGREVDEAGKLPSVINTDKGKLLTTTIFVKYNYEELGRRNKLWSITVAAVPNGMLQAQYNPTARETIWRAGRNAPTRGEVFRVRLVFKWLKDSTNWRVQSIPIPPTPFTWDD